MRGRTYKIFTDCNGHRFVANSKLGPVVAAISRKSGCGVTRVYAGADATALVHSVGLHTQAEVIYLHSVGTPGYGPANPVNRSTHCEFNDGVAYPNWPAGWAVPWWGCGMDLYIPDIPDFIRVAVQQHNLVTRTYPNSRGEAQHCNFRRAPRLPSVWKTRPLKRGSKGRRVRSITRMLCKIPDKHGVLYLTEPANTITTRVEDAIKKFQRDHHQKSDGIVGIQTRSQILASYHYHKKK